MSRFEQFTKERQYLANVTPATLEWYGRCFKWLPNDSPNQDDLKAVVIRMRERGLTAAGCNCVIRCLNAYLHWSHVGSDVKCSPACKHPRIAKLKEPATVPDTFSERQVRQLVTWKPKGRYQIRLHLLVLLLLDTGARISEVLTLRVGYIDFGNLLVTLDGKGRKLRVVPFSFELRRALYRWVSAEELKAHDLLLGTGQHTKQGRRNVLRAVKQLCKTLGFEPPRRTIHAFRHTMAVNYLRRGGSVFHLQKVLGHSTLEMTRRYANLVTTDLQAAHERISLLK